MKEIATVAMPTPRDKKKGGVCVIFYVPGLVWTHLRDGRQLCLTPVPFSSGQA